MNETKAPNETKEPKPNSIVDTMLTPGGGKTFSNPSTYLNFLHKPHTMLTLGVLVLFGIYFAVFKENEDPNANSRHAVIGVIVAFLAFSVLHFHDHSFIKRPHPLFWRFVRGTAVLFLLFKVYLLFLTRDQARQVYHFIDPKLGVPLETERDYAVDCRIYTPENPDSKFANVKGTIDIFVIAHSVGWFGKALIFRDQSLLWIVSIMFEICEYSLQHNYENFRECWWDHLLLDVLGCNLFGMAMGYALLKSFDLKYYSWDWKKK